MGTLSLPSLRMHPEGGAAKTPDSPSSPEKNKPSQDSKEAGGVLPSPKAKSSKSSGHKKHSFAVAYRQALDHLQDAPMEEPEKPALSHGRSKGPTEGSRKGTASSRRKSRSQDIDSMTLDPGIMLNPTHDKKSSGLSLKSHGEGPASGSAPWGPSPSKNQANPTENAGLRTVADLANKAAESPLLFSSLPSVAASDSAEKIKGILGLRQSAKTERRLENAEKSSDEESFAKALSNTEVRPFTKHAAGHSLSLSSHDRETMPSEGESKVSSREASVPERPGVSPVQDNNTLKNLTQPLQAGGGAEAASGTVSVAHAAGASEGANPVIPDEIPNRVGMLARTGGGEVALDVRPPHLGPVGVRVHVDPHTRLVTVQLSSHDPRIRHLLNEKEGRIKDSLSQSGYVLDRFSVVSQNAPSSPIPTMAAISGSAMDSSSDRSMTGDGGASQGGGSTANGFGQGQDLGNLSRQGSGSPGQEGGSGTFREFRERSEHPESDGRELLLPAEGENDSNFGYHRIA